LNDFYVVATDPTEQDCQNFILLNEDVACIWCDPLNRKQEHRFIE